MQSNSKTMRQIEKSFPSAKEGVGNIASAARSSFEDVVDVMIKEIKAADTDDPSHNDNNDDGMPPLEDVSDDDDDVVDKTFEVFKSLVEKWVAKLKRCLTEASKLDAAYNNATKEFAQLSKWHEAQAKKVFGVSVLNEGDELRDAIEDARDVLLDLKRKIKVRGLLQSSPPVNYF